MMRALVEVGAAACAGAAGWGAGILLTGDAQPAVRWVVAAGLGVALIAIQMGLLAGGRRPGRGGGETVEPRGFLQRCAAGAVEPGARLTRVAGGLAELL